MVRREALLLSVLATVPCARLLAQDPVGSIRGIVTDKDFEAPLGGATVTIVQLQRKVVSGEQGNFTMPGVPPGTYTLSFTKDGYIGQVRTVTVLSGGVKEVEVALVGDFTVMEEFIVQDFLDLGGGNEAGLLEIRFKSAATLDAVSAEFMRKAGASDAASAMRLIAGATVAPDGKSPVVRGLPDRYVSSQMNGVRLPTADENKRAVQLDQFPSTVIDSIQVQKTFTPDQQGDASGGAVDVRLKGIPDKPFFVSWSVQTGYNSQVTGRTKFLSYDGGGVSVFGRDDGRRQIQEERLGENWKGAVGVTRQRAPFDVKLGAAIGAMHEMDDGVRIGGFATLFYERDSSFFDNGVDDSLWVEKRGAKLSPRTFQGAASDGAFYTGLFDVTRGTQSVEWGGLATVGVESENHKLSIALLQTHNAQDRATMAQDTRGKEHFYPGHDPDDPDSPGFGSFGSELTGAPYIRLETLEYTERDTDTLQFHGQHTFDLVPDNAVLLDPEFDWTYAKSSSSFDQPDKRQFGAAWTPGYKVGTFDVPPVWTPYKPGANFTLGNLQRIWKEIDETSEQYIANLKLPFKQWTESEGAIKAGWFRDRVGRSFNLDSFSNFSDNSTWSGPFGEHWTSIFRYQDHPITASTEDVDYEGDIDIDAYYAMLDLPLTSWVSVIGGVRVERTRIGIINDAEQDARWFPKGAPNGVVLNPGDADVQIDQRNKLPSIALRADPLSSITFRASYNETIARQTFKEITPIIQQEFLGGPIFIGNPELEISDVENYDLRLDYRPYDGGLFSASWFRKDIKKPIEYVQRIGTFNFTTAVNYPEGRLEGYELETRHKIGHFLSALDGLTLGLNATFIDSEVTLPDDEQADLVKLNVPMRTRDMTNAPEYLFNLFATYDLDKFGAQFGVFYTVNGDTLIAGPGQSVNNFIPSIYAREFDTLNASWTQRLSEGVTLKMQAKNLTNPKIKTVYRSDYIGDDATQTSFTKGIDYTISITGEIRF
ncbi:MAG: carboxypeptidase regulatory-like domain-containing protein [Planctomycetes bacterium]|nr:carboxypeptidase regulatory-like domain-containing protein [Planctomycetota bacterium]